MTRATPSRRDLPVASLSAAGLAGLSLPTDALAQGAELPATPSCEGHGTVTPRQTEGPYFTPSSPQRSDLRADGEAGCKPPQSRPRGSGWPSMRIWNRK